MCIAIVKPAGQWVSKEHLYNSFIANPHGAGFAYRNDAGAIVIRKGYFSFDAFYKAYAAEVKSEHPALVHFRISTAGKKNAENCHPFALQHGAMMHNGPTLNWSSCKGDDNRSDTWQFADDFIQTLAPAQLRAIKPMIEHYIGTDKIAFLFDDGEFLICNEKNGQWNEGCWYSNSSFRGYFTTDSRSLRNHDDYDYGYGGYHGGSSYTTTGGKGSTKSPSKGAQNAPIMRTIGIRPDLFRCRWSTALHTWAPTDILVETEHLVWDETLAAYLPDSVLRPIAFDKKYVYEATAEAAKKEPLDYQQDSDWTIIGHVLHNEAEMRLFLMDASPWNPPAPAPAAAAPAPAPAPATTPTDLKPSKKETKALSLAADASAAKTASVVH